MTEVLDEKYDAATGPEDFAVSVAEDPPEPPVDEAAETAEAPYGWTRGRDGHLRPKVKPGRPKLPPGPDDIPADRQVPRAEDRPPAPSTGKDRAARDDDVPDMPRGGVIAKGVNKLYRRGGKIIRAMDHDLGTAIIACTRKGDDPDDADELTVGEAWEQLAKTNPRIRKFLLKAVAGGAWGDLIMAHAPIGIALLMKPWVRALIPIERLVESMAEPDEDTPEGEGGLPGGMTAADFDQMRDMAQRQAERMAAKMGMRVSPEEMAEAAAAAQSRFEGAVPPAFARAQPRRRSRAERRSG